MGKMEMREGVATRMLLGVTPEGAGVGGVGEGDPRAPGERAGGGRGEAPLVLTWAGEEGRAGERKRSRG